MAKFGKLTALEISKKPGPCKLGDGNGLYLVKEQKGHVGYWKYCYQIRGESRAMGLGSYATLSLEDARDQAMALSKQRREGLDPLAERRSKKVTNAADTMTFAAVAAEYVADLRHSRKPKYIDWVEKTLKRDILPLLGDSYVRNIDTPMVRRTLMQPATRCPQSGRARPFEDGTPLWLAVPMTGKLARGIIESVFSRAIAMGYMKTLNPARWKDNLQYALPPQNWKPTKHPSMPYKEVPAFVRALRAEGDSLNPNLVRSHGVKRPARLNCVIRSIKTGMLALELTVLCALRVNECLCATWGEIDIACLTIAPE